jgi:hypothetical protein
MVIRTKIRLNNALMIILSLVIILAVNGCQKVINVDLNEASPRIVIEGLIIDRPGPYIVTISKSGSYFNQPVLPPVSGALAIVTDNSGVTDTLREISTGNYTTSKTTGVPGKRYTLTVISENMEYTGTSTMGSHIPIDSLKLVKSQFQHFEPGGNTHDGINMEIHCFFKDPVEKNFYRIRVFKNDSINTENYRLYDDQYTNGQETELRVTHAEAQATYRIELLSLDKQTYGYYRTLEDLLYTNPFFGSTPANPNNNLSNGALGYFGSCAISSKMIIITDSLIKTVR